MYEAGCKSHIVMPALRHWEEAFTRRLEELTQALRHLRPPLLGA